MAKQKGDREEKEEEKKKKNTFFPSFPSQIKSNSLGETINNLHCVHLGIIVIAIEKKSWLIVNKRKEERKKKKGKFQTLRITV